MSIPEFGKAKYEYDAQDYEELSFREKDVVECVDKDPSGWYRVRLVQQGDGGGERINGETGSVPSNYFDWGVPGPALLTKAARE
mmetsp:Transcript_11079/g.27953  ORF Transcript_11079/g.27953 Transcript_11079/m.27953 type:complete len:84 (-) Transcript_11079:71-322(-)|eukprot:CAMPEP_0177667210 /NCGR_PEP_ID=MMETSP0447-20121125/21997_1 /TAXON_ID=0 /ORGANISM="Stygamoeba regulata, Strain BSH-02190019" /LENGTH=83 /DNA_ID=CAMNT_0019173417 /DNA_START=49 /DNA_END=300 /DNA_ORIENTATION=+